MPPSSRPPVNQALTQYGLEDRLVVLARTLHARDPEMEVALKESVANWNRFGETCLGQALYRHRSFFQNPSGTPAWSHTELSYFRSMVPQAAITDLVADKQPAKVDLVRAEILLTTPCSFILPRNWRGLSDRSEWVASLEFIQVKPRHFDEYRNVMRDYIGPAARKLVGGGRFGTFRAMETAAVIYRDPAVPTDWNQIHLCEFNPVGFEGFGREFETALRDERGAGGTSDVFADLAGVRAVPRWTFNDPVIEMDLAVGQAGKPEK